MWGGREEERDLLCLFLHPQAPLIKAPPHTVGQLDCKSFTFINRFSRNIHAQTNQFNATGKQVSCSLNQSTCRYIFHTCILSKCA